MQAVRRPGTYLDVAQGDNGGWGEERREAGKLEGRLRRSGQREEETQETGGCMGVRGPEFSKEKHPTVVSEVAKNSQTKGDEWRCFLMGQNFKIRPRIKQHMTNGKYANCLCTHQTLD